MPHAATTAPATRSDHFRLLTWTLAALFCLVAWDAWGQDRALAHVFGSTTGFPLRDHWFFVQVMHEGPRRLAWLIVLALVVFIWRPVGFLRRIRRGERVQLALTTLLSLAVVTGLKYASTTSCPWDLTEFGGVARYASHWALGTLDGGGGKCFPAGHASAGFAFIGGYFALRHHQPRAARIWFVCALVAGLALGGAQQVRGAHFLSHTLWTGWLCWTTGWICDIVARTLHQHRAGNQTTGSTGAAFDAAA